MRVPPLKDVEAWKGGTLSAGSHNVQIEKVTEGTSANGHPELTVLFRAIESDPEAGAVITDWLTITEKSLGKVRAFLESAGMDPGAFEAEVDVRPGDLEGRYLVVIVGDHTPPGTTQVVQRVKGYRHD